MTLLGPSDPKPTRSVAAAVGFFDGVHLGHRYLLSRVAAEARAHGLAAMAVTFAQHPLSVVRPDAPLPPLLTTPSERVSLLGSLGIDYCAMLDFTRDMSLLTAEEFMRSVLAERLGVRLLVMGYDHRLGHDSDHTPEHYRAAGLAAGIEVVRAGRFAPPSGITISSTTIRRAIAEGDIAGATAMLGHRYSLTGSIVGGHRVGTTLGFPTANVDALHSGKAIPARGVYSAIATTADGMRHAAVVNIGTRPTIGNGSDTTIEAHLIRFSGDIYGQSLTLEFASRLRPERRFATREALREQIARDSDAALRTAEPLL